MVEKDSNMRFPQHLSEDIFGDVGFMRPSDRLAVSGHLVMLTGAPVELQSITADDFFPSEVGPTQPAGDHAAQVVAGFEQRYLQPFPGRADSGDDAPGCSTVDDNVEFLGMARNDGCESYPKDAIGHYLFRKPLADARGSVVPMTIVSNLVMSVAPFA
jgi:hypothetical protein